MTEEEQREFWRRHAESRKKMDEDFAKLPFEKKLEIAEQMRANHEALYFIETTPLMEQIFNSYMDETNEWDYFSRKLQL